jgi:hypothetical protein
MTLAALRSLLVATLDRFSWLGPLALRLSLGAVFVASGWGKLHSLDKVTEFFGTLGIPFPGVNATLASITELVGGALIASGSSLPRYRAADGHGGRHPHRPPAGHRRRAHLPRASSRSPTSRASCGWPPSGKASSTPFFGRGAPPPAAAPSLAPGGVSRHFRSRLRPGGYDAGSVSDPPPPPSRHRAGPTGPGGAGSSGPSAADG